VAQLRTVENGGGGRESGQLKLAAHTSAALRIGKMGAFSARPSINKPLLLWCELEAFTPIQTALGSHDGSFS